VLGCHESPTECGGALTPVAAAAAEALLLEDWLAKARVDGAEPAACGVNVTVTGTLVPGVSTSGSEIPLTEYWELLRLSEVIVTEPEFAERFKVWLLLDPTTTLPKLNEPGDRLRAAPAKPTPFSARPTADPVEFVTCKLPEKSPEPLGAKTT